MNPSVVFDLRQRYSTTSSNYEKVPSSQQKSPITNIEVEEIDYERPYWVAPDLSGEHGNHFVLVSLVNEHLENLGYKQEAQEFKDIVLDKMNKNNKNVFDENTNIYQIINKFVNYFDSISEKIIDGEQYIKITKQPKEFEQLEEFKNVTLQSVQKLKSDGFDFDRANIYGRSILFYVKDRDTMEWLFNNVYDINKTEDYLKLFELDVLNTSLLVKHSNPEILDFLLSKMLTKEKEFPELIQKWCVGVDTFSRCMEDSIVKQLNVIFRPEQDFHQYTKHVTTFAKLFSKLNKVYPEFTNSIIKTGSNAFKNDSSKLKFWKEHMETEYLKESLDQSLQLKKPDSPKTKKLKV